MLFVSYRISRELTWRSSSERSDDVLYVGAGNVEDGAEDGLCGGAADHEAVHVGELDQLVSVRLRYAATVHDSHDRGLFLTDVCADPASDELCGLLGLVSARDGASAEGPERLVDENDIGPV